MLSAEDNEILCRVEGDAPMGRLMRRHWLPACLSEEVADRDGAPVRVRREDVNLGVAVDLAKKDGTRTLLVPNIKKANKLRFSDEGFGEIERMHRRLMGNLDLALNVFISGETPMARARVGTTSMSSTGASYTPVRNCGPESHRGTRTS